MKYLSLFTGIGGFELGIGDKGECIGYSEIDKYAVQIFEKHFPGVKNYGDIKTIDATLLPDFDFICGGFPCQAFSIAGARKGFEDTRGTLFFDIARILRAKQPRLLLLENVKGLLSHDDGKTFGVIIATLTELGYDVQWQVLNSKNHGVPQNRERVFIIGNLRGSPRPKVFPFGPGEEIHSATQRDEKKEIAATLGAARGGADVNDDFIVTPALRASDSKRGDNQTVVVEDFYPGRVREFTESPTLRSGRAGLKIRTFVSRKGKTEFKHQDVANTIDAHYYKGLDAHQQRTAVKEGPAIRRLTPTECERLQGFPDGWTVGLSDTQRYKTLGNAVTVNVVRDICTELFA